MDKDIVKKKFYTNIKNTNYDKLDKKTQKFFEEVYDIYPFSFQELKQLIDFGIDFKMWQEKPIHEVFTKNYKNKKEAFSSIRQIWEDLKQKTHSYNDFNIPKTYKKTYSTYEFQADKLALGSCPVASEATRCCNLLTLDAVNSCGFDCSYCSIQSFYKQNRVGFDKNFAKNLEKLKLNPNETYHIGTGQSSDSLMWGDKHKILTSLFKFADKNQNVILEFKTKSKNINFFLNHEVPKNIIVTWSLNTQTIIDNEEHLTASLKERIDSAKKLANKGVLVGFHFHPMVVYENYLDEYQEIFNTLLENFDPKNVALISLGTLTFIKPVINRLRKREFYSKILQMPLLNANGKLSYSLDQKKQMFSFAFNSLKPWHNKVYFYMCMEEKSLWRDVFGHEYKNNDEMERDMKKAYFSKINQIS